MSVTASTIAGDAASTPLRQKVRGVNFSDGGCSSPSYSGQEAAAPVAYGGPEVRRGEDAAAPVGVDANVIMAEVPKAAGDAASSPLLPPRFFSREAIVNKTKWSLPHWSQDQCACFVTWRTADSIPQEKIESLRVEREEWIAAHPLFMAEYRERCGREAACAGQGVRRGQEAAAPVGEVEAQDCRRGQEAAAPVGANDLSAASTITGDAASSPLRRLTLSAEEYAECLARYRELCEGRVQKWLDAGYGSCLLRRAEIRKIVEDSIFCFDRERYVIYASVVMPNHVHVLFMPMDGYRMANILRDWKGFTARRINRLTGTDGAFWQKESWDHLVRNERQFAKYLSYIKANDGDKAYDAYAAMRRQDEAEAES